LFLELGVFSGQSIWVIAQRTSNLVHGFDSFEGLPEDWTGNTGMQYEYVGYARHQVALVVRRAPSRPAP
jgi:hypothetical protein